jgi:hypothetical protein
MTTQIKYRYPSKSFAMDAEAISIIASDPTKLEKLGISASDQMISSFNKNAISSAMDAGIVQPVTTAANGVPVQFLQSFLPGVVNVLTKVRKADVLAPVLTAGEWWMEEVILKTMEHLGTPQLYSDHGGIPLASFNEVYERRQIVRFELGVQNTQLSDMRSAATGTNPQNEKRGAAATAFEMLRNDIAFNGFNVGTGKTYGLLNDPNLPAYVDVAAGTGGDTEWSTKTVAERVSDLVTAAAALRVQSGGNIDPEKDAVLLTLPLGIVDLINESDSSFANGMTVKKWILDNYSNWTIESVPQFDGADAGDSVFYLQAVNVADSGTDGGDVMPQIVPAKMRAMGTVPNEKGGSTEGYTSAMAGVFVKRPFGIVRYSAV